MMRAVSAPPEQSSQPVLGIALKLASVLFLAAMAACVKYLGADVPSGQTVFFRGSIAMVVVALVAWRTDGLSVLRTTNWQAHALRSIAGTASMFCWFSALTMIPLAEMTAISFTIPLFLTVLAMLVLGERIHWYRWTALGIGFAGVVIIVAPQLTSDAGSALGVSVGLASAVLASFALMFLRRMSGREHVLTITFYFFLTSSSVGLLSALVRGWPMPTATQWLVLLLIGILGAAGQLLMTYSYRYAEASMLAPLDYVTMLVAVAIGYWLFAEIPHVSTWIGAPLVIAAGVIIIWREYVKMRAIASAGRIAP
jgi:drug/metabolite transporter (DMT)-like permease